MEVQGDSESNRCYHSIILSLLQNCEGIKFFLVGPAPSSDLTQCDSVNSQALVQVWEPGGRRRARAAAGPAPPGPRHGPSGPRRVPSPFR
eukprot:430922-Hanusia_phi.AAC.1